jgi:hypothetical protein
MNAPATRDSRIDLIRGLFILTMVVDHFGHLAALIGNQSAAKVYTYQSLGWSSAAEFFVFFSGYVLATVYGTTLATRGYWRLQLRAVHRAWELYARNAVIWLLCLLLIGVFFAGNGDLAAATRIDLAGQYQDGGILAFTTLRYMPTFLEVLPLYMVLMLVAPVFVWLQTRSGLMALAASALVWLAVQIDPELNFHSDTGAWNFNPYAWQFVFFLGMWSAKAMPLTEVNRDHRRTRLTVVLAVLAGCLALKLLDKYDVALPLLGQIAVPAIGKPNVEPLRLLHFLLVVYLAALVLPSSHWLQQRWWARKVALVGQQSLDCFCASILLCYVTAGIFSLSGRGTTDYFLLVAVNVLGVVLCAGFFQWIKTPPWRSTNAAAPESTPASQSSVMPTRPKVGTAVNPVRH